MKICDGIHQIRIDFEITEKVKRYVYIYLIEAESCYLVDSGVVGSDRRVAEYLCSIGRKITDIRGIFLTHAHPDHIGSAAQIKKLSGGKIYAREGEKKWIEDIDLQFKERPIPNFYNLVGTSAKVDVTLRDQDTLQLEPGLTIQAISTAGHSLDQFSFFIKEKGILFIGDTIPVYGDIPIYIDERNSMDSLTKLEKLSSSVELFCPAWDKIYSKSEGRKAIEKGKNLILTLANKVENIQKQNPNIRLEECVENLCKEMHTEYFMNNPLFVRTVASHLK